MSKQIEFSLLPHQKQLLTSNKRFVCMICGRGAGKTFSASLLCALKALKGERILVFAQGYKALTENLFNEIRLRLDKIIGYDKYTYNKGQVKIHIPSSGGTIYGLTYENIDSCRGYTEIHSLILDEGCLAPANILEVAVPCMRGTGDDTQIYITSTPKAASFLNKLIMDKLKSEPDTIELIKAKTTDNIYISNTEYDLMLKSFRDKTMIEQELNGEILEGVSNLSLAKIIKNWEWENTNSVPYQVVVGIDPSGFGNDKTSICIRDNKHIYGFWYCDDGQVGNVSTTLYLALRSIGNPKVQCVYIDAGYGKEIYDNLSNLYSCMKVNFGSPSKDKAYLNTRAEMYFSMCYKLSYLTFNDETSMNKVKEEIESIEYLYSGENKIRLIPKDQIREVLGRSPDTTDSLALTFYEDVDIVEYESKPIRNRLGNPED